MDLREIIQRRFQKKNATLSNENKPDPPASNDTTTTTAHYKNDDSAATDVATIKTVVEATTTIPLPQRRKQPIELGTIQYCNITGDGKHGDYNTVLQVAASSHLNKPIFANFVEWSGWQGCQDAGRIIFSHPMIVRVVEEYFIPAAFNTWDRNDTKYNKVFRTWSGGLHSSWWGYLRIISNDGQTILSGTKQITGGHGLQDVIRCIRDALQELDIEIPNELRL